MGSICKNFDGCSNHFEMEITNDNFSKHVNLIRDAIENADFVSLDTEFTGLRAQKCACDRYFDPVDIRYRKLRCAVQSYTLCQLGIACFRKSPNFNKYEVTSFNIYTFPRCLSSLSDANFEFSCQTSTIEFLRCNNFDFNKFLYAGVPYMTKVGAQSVQQRVAIGDFSDFDERFDKGEQFLSDVSEILTNWLSLNKDKEGYIDVDFIEADRLSRVLVVHRLSKSFPQFRISFNESLTKLRFEVPCEDHSNKCDYTDQLMRELRGCGIIFDFLSDGRKPIIAHNCFMDLLYIYDKFFDRLPENYADFKEKLHSKFGLVIDTKYIALNMINDLTNLGCKSYSLGGLYRFLELEDKFKFPKPGHAAVTLDEGSRKYDIDHGKANFLHEAGYDAYLVGVIFLRLSHFLHFKEKSQAECRPIDLSLNMSAVDRFINKINLIRSSSTYVNLAGQEKIYTKPSLLVARLVKDSYNLKHAHEHLIKKLSSVSGQLDTELMKSATRTKPVYLVSIDDQYEVGKILDMFQNDPLFVVKNYRSSNSSRLLAISAGAVVVLAFSVFLVKKKFSNKF